VLQQQGKSIIFVFFCFFYELKRSNLYRTRPRLTTIFRENFHNKTFPLYALNVCENFRESGFETAPGRYYRFADVTSTEL